MIYRYSLLWDVPHRQGVMIKRITMSSMRQKGKGGGCFHEVVSRRHYIVFGVATLRDCSRDTTALRLFRAAYESGVLPTLSGLSGLTSSRSSSIATTLSRPHSAANESGVRPSLSGLSGLTSARPSNISTTRSCPNRAANKRCPAVNI